MKPELIVNANSQKAMTQHAEEIYPEECCGFMLGTVEENDSKTVTGFLPVENTREVNRARRFEISAEDYRKAELYALKNGYDLVGVYHSHPDHPAEPSEYDLSQALPFFSYIIISVRNGKTADVTSWELNEKKEFEHQPIKTQKPKENIDG